MNDGTIDGNLVRDCEIKTTASGYTVINFSIAHNKSVKRGDEWEQVAHFFDCTYWTKKSDYWGPKLVKGAHVAFKFELQQDRWENEGKQMSRVKLNVTGFPVFIKHFERSTEAVPAPQASQCPEQYDGVPF